MTDLPRKAVARSAKLATLPLGFAGRTASGLGKRIGGKPAEAVAAELQQRTAEQLFAVLGELKGGAMKFGQALSILEAALPEEIAEPVPRHADPAAGGRPAAARAPACTRCSPSSSGGDWRRRFESVRRHARGRRIDRPGAPRRLGRRACRSPSRSSTPVPARP